MARNSKTHWVEKSDGWHKTGSGGVSHLTNNVFNQQVPPMRNAAGVPMKNFEEIDTAQWIKEVNERDANQKTD
jgi:hypothetical protein